MPPNRRSFILVVARADHLSQHAPLTGNERTVSLIQQRSTVDFILNAVFRQPAGHLSARSIEVPDDEKLAVMSDEPRLFALICGRGAAMPLL